MAILPTGQGDITDPNAWASNVQFSIAVGASESSAYYGYDSQGGDPPINGSFGTVYGGNNALGIVLTLAATTGTVVLSIQGPDLAAPVQSIFTTLVIEDGAANPSYASSAATYTTDDNIATWTWSSTAPAATIPNTWNVFLEGNTSLQVPPFNFTNVPQNTNFPRNGDGRYWWTGDLSHIPAGPIYFIGNPSFLTSTMQLSWAINQLSNDGSAMVLGYSTDGGATWTSVNLPLGLQGLQSGSFDIDLSTGPATGLAIRVTYTGGTANELSSQSEVAIAITRNANSAAIWDNPDPFDPTAYNGQVIDEPGYDNLETLTTRLLIRLGFSNQVDNPPPGMVPMLEEFLQSSQNFLWRTYDQLRTRRWFRWKLIPLQRQYSLLDNDENILQMYSLDPNKTVVWAGIQDTRNVWYPLIQGIPPQLYTMIDKPWRPARYEIRNGLEVYPSPDQTYFLWLKANFGLLPLVEGSDTTTIDSELVFLHALANAKAHYGQPDANNIEAQANRLRAELIATTHKTGHYVPGTIPIPPAVRPTLIQFNGNQSG